MRSRLLKQTSKQNYIIATYNVTSTSSNTAILNPNFDTSQVKYMVIDDEIVKPTRSYKFSSNGLHDIIIHFNSSFKSCKYMFYYCSNLTSLDISNFDTSNVTDMSYMFQECGNLTSLDVSNFNTSNVTNMGYMFGVCSNLTSLDISNFDTSKVTNMNDMFYYCSNLTSLDLSNFDTSNVTNMRYMFSSCQKLTSLDISNFDTSKVTNMSYMFQDCSSLNTLTMTGDISKLSSYFNMFSGITTTGTFYYNSDYDYLKIISKLPSTWTATPI